MKSKQIVKQSDIARLRLQLSAFAFFHDFNDFVIDRRFHTAFSAPFTNDSVDRIDLAGLILLQFLKHRRLDIAMLFHGDRDQHSCEGSLDCAFVIK